ncbi:MAG TPA: SHOCT domain-containing protein [Longimicrobiaceae bacterium]|nr:SHOCT domain-containing protein [Longimicrobiaceae bacterium]
MTDRTDDDALPLAASAWVFLSLAGVACGMTFLFLGMRAVMEIGGACAEGASPYVIARPCPRGVPAAVVGGFWAGIVCLGIYIWQTTSRGIPNLDVLAWPALFLSLGWNFLEFAFRPPGGGGPVWGWLIPGVAFIAMAGAPLAMAAGPQVRRFTSFRGARPPPEPEIRRPTPPPDAPRGAQVVSALERLAALHASGALSDEEYRVAKARVLDAGAPP